MSISIVIPVKNDFESFKLVFKSCLSQSLSPNEIIVIDSSSENLIDEYLKKIKSSIDIKYFKSKNKFPGEARNIGINNCDFDLIAFIDSKTIPKFDWLYCQNKKLKSENLDVVFGNTKYIAKNNIQETIRAATFGNILHTTTPGSLIKKNIAKNNYFIEKVRTADDLEWRERLIKKNYNYSFAKKLLTTYEFLPNSIISLIKRYFIYSFHTAQVNVDNKIKFFYFFIISLLLMLIIPRWNQYLPNWNISHPLYIHNQTKFVLLIFISLILIIVSFQNLPFLKKNIKNNFLKIFLLVSLIIFIYNWNFNIANFIEKSTLYFPHITKIFIILVFLTSFIIRGIYYPLSRNIKKTLLFPIKWIKVGFYGLIIDVVKTPAYFYGALLPKFFLKKNHYLNDNPQIIFFPKYGLISPSYRVRFLSYKKYLNENNINVLTKELFSENFFINKIHNNKIQIFKLIYFYFKRLKDLVMIKKPFLAVVHIELLPYVPIIAELIFKFRKIPYVIDIDDSVYLRFKNKNKFFYIIDKIKFIYMFKNSCSILAGNHFHVNSIKKYNQNILYLPTNINLNYNLNFQYLKKNKKFTIVWIGTPSTTFYLKSIVNVLNKLVKENDIEIKLIGADMKIIKELICTSIKWKLQTEISEISKCHLGIMPLNNSDWELGKCAYKILQYMSLKLPVVASPVGVNTEIITDNFNGMLATNENEWYSKILLLKNNTDLNKKISEEGYNTVKNKYNIDIFKEIYKTNLIKSFNQCYK